MKGRSTVHDHPKRAADAGIAVAGQAGSSPGAAVRPFFYGRRCRIPSLRDNGFLSVSVPVGKIGWYRASAS